MVEIAQASLSPQHYEPTPRARAGSGKGSIDRDSSIYILDVLMGRVNDIISPVICLFYTFFKLKYSGTNADISKQ